MECSRRQDSILSSLSLVAYLSKLDCLYFDYFYILNLIIISLPRILSIFGKLSIFWLPFVIRTGTDALHQGHLLLCLQGVAETVSVLVQVAKGILLDHVLDVCWNRLLLA